MDIYCPYCEKIGQESKEHIFSDFLGGKRTILACKECNNTFGHDFEGRLCKSLSPLIVVLAISGLKPKKVVTWKYAFTDELTNIVYDLNSESEAFANIKVEKLFPTGTKISGNVRYINPILKLAKKKKENIHIEYQTHESFIPNFHFKFNLDDNLRRTAIKMSVALSHAFGKSNFLHTRTKHYLLYGTFIDDKAMTPSIIGYIPYPQLDNLRPALGHTIYVEGNKKKKLCYSVVQFFGTFQLYSILNGQYQGEDFSLLGTHNSITHEENFNEIKRLDLAMPNSHPPIEHYYEGINIMQAKLQEQVTACFGQNELLYGIKNNVPY